MDNLLVIPTKIQIPHLRKDVIVRASMFNKLDEALEGGTAITLISAPAGYGKTSLLASWLWHSNKDAAWLSLDVDDDNLPRLILYIISALQTVRPEIGHKALEILNASGWDSVQSDAILSSLIQELLHFASPALLVLDDFHFLSSLEAQKFITDLIEYTHPYLQCFITTRNEPALLPLAKWRTRSMLVEIRGDDLRFTLDEATQFLRRVMRLDLSSEQVNLLLQRTEGWVAGLQLAALTVKNKDAGFTIDGTQRDITDYLMSEVFNQLSASKREFLLQTSVVQRMNSSLCNAITQREDSQSMLETIESDNLFIVALDEKREWFRYHHLFLEFLRKRLLTDFSQTAVNKMNEYASHWLAQNGYMIAAIDHALAALDYEYAGCLIAPQSQRWMEHGEISTILNYLDRLPRELTWNQWDLTLWYGWAYAVRGELTSADLWTNRLEELISPQIESASQNGKESIPQNLQDAYTQVLAIRSVIARGNKDFPKAIAFSEQALQIVPESNQNLQATISTLLSSAILEAGDFDEAESLLNSTHRRFSHNGSSSFIAFTLLLNASALAVMRGQLHRAHELNEEALRLTQTKSMERLAFLPQLRLGRIHYFWNQLERAKGIVTTALEQADLEHYTEAVIRGQITLAWIQDAEEQYPQVLHTLEIAEHWAIDHHKHESAQMVKAVRAQSQFWAGEKEAVMSWMKTLGWDIFNPSQTGTIPNDEAFFLLCQVLIKAEARQRAQDLLDWRMTDSKVQRRDSTILRIYLMQALLHQELGDLTLAVAFLTKALELAMPENYIRPFFDEGRMLLPLLRRIPKTHFVKDFAQKILAFRAEPPSVVFLAEPLSKQELAILRLMSQGRSNPEIAEQLILAVSTVRWYVKQIFRKLEVHNRTQAASRAQKLNLL